MTIKELADYIRKNKPGLNYSGVHPWQDESTVLQYTRHELYLFVHITDEHVFECCEKASSFEEHIELCRPLAIKDTEDFRREQSKPPPKGRTVRRFR